MFKNSIVLIMGFVSLMPGEAWSASFPIHEHGYWCGTAVNSSHQFDGSLAEALITFFEKENAGSIVDFGCGPGRYVKLFRDRNLFCEGYDGNPDTSEITYGMCKVLDLAKPLQLSKKFDWVLSLEVGEHIPQQYESVFIQNLHDANKKGIVLSWAIPGQGGDGHFNERSNEHIKNIFLNLGYVNDKKAEAYLRASSRLPWFKNTIMVFRRIPKGLKRRG